MKIGIAIDSLQKYGGTTRSTWEIAEKLSEQHEVIILTQNAELSGAEPFKCHIVNVSPKIPYLRNLIFAWKVSRLKSKLKLDVLNVQGSNGIWQDIVTAHSVHKKWFFFSLSEVGFFSKAWWKKILNPIHYVVILIETLQYSFGLHKKIIAISDNVRRDLLSHFPIKPENIHVVHHGINISEFNSEKRSRLRATTRSELGIMPQDYVMIFVGHEFRRKGLAPLLRAISKCKKSKPKLLIVGQDDPAPFFPLVESLNLKSDVFFLGLQRSMDKWYAAADVFALPTSYEAFGLVVTESMAAGLPVIVSKDAGAAELIKDHQDGILLKRWDDVDEIADAIDRLSDPKLQIKMGTSAKESALRRTWDDAARETLAVFQLCRD